MQIVRYGDRISPGHYRIHSRFCRVGNYACRDRLLSVVDETVGAGPLDLVVRGPCPEDIDTIEVTADGRVSLDGEVQCLDPARRYDSRMVLPAGWTLPGLRHGLALFDERLRERAHPLSLAFLLDPTREAHFASSFERAFVSRVKWCVGEMARGHVSAIAGLAGLGFGLTPSGDDFILGQIHAGHLLARLGHPPLSRERVVELAPLLRPRSVLGRSLLACALASAVTEPVQHLIGALCAAPRPEALCGAVDRVLACGATSGADWATGLVLAVRQALLSRGRAAA